MKVAVAVTGGGGGSDKGGFLVSGDIFLSFPVTDQVFVAAWLINYYAIKV